MSPNFTGRRNNINYDVLNDLMSSGEVALSSEDGQVQTTFADNTRALRISGMGNEGPRQEFSDRLFELNDDDFVKRAETAIWLSAYAANNYNSDYHWHADICYYEALRRGKAELYEQAWKRASNSG